MHILFLFFDGWGLGANDASINPFLSASMPTLRQLFGGKMPTNESAGPFSPARSESSEGNVIAPAPNHVRPILVPTDATLGVPGLPQSATGQTTLFTGINAPLEIGEHSGPYPNEALRTILARDNLFMRLVAAQCRVAFANAYPPIFFERLARNKARRTAISHAVSDAGVRYRNIDDLRAGRAISAFVTNQVWVSRGADVPLISAHTAGANLARLAQENDLTAFEYFLTDAAGHKADTSFTARVLTEVDELLRGILDTLHFEESLVVISSDHGNVEDASSTVHTRNPVPTILIGAGADKLAPRIHSLADITPGLVDLLLDK